MYKITQDSKTERYTVCCYNFIHEANFYTFLYSARDLTFDGVASLLQGRLKYTDDLDWIPAITRLTNQPAIIGEDGILRAVPIATQKDIRNEESTRKANNDS